VTSRSTAGGDAAKFLSNSGGLGAGIERGGVAARARWNLINPEIVQPVPTSSLPDDLRNDVIRTLTLTARSVIKAIAVSTHMNYRPAGQDVAATCDTGGR